MGLIILGYLAAYTIINFFGFPLHANHDMYADTLVARHMWQQKTFFPSNWVFGNQYYILATPVLSALFYGITGSLNLSMALATSVMTIFIILTFAWMIKPFVNKIQLISSVAMLLASIPVVFPYHKQEGQIFFIMCSYYSCYLITIFVVWGVYIRQLKQISPKPQLMFIIGIILSFAMGMQSLRQMCVMVLPLCAVEFIRIGLIIVKTRSLPSRGNFFITLNTAIIFTANLAGYLFIKMLDVPAVTIYGGTHFSPFSDFKRNMGMNISSLAQITGFRSLLMDHGRIFNIYYALHGFVITVLIIVSFFVLMKRQERQKNLLNTYILLCVLSLLAVLFANSILGVNIRGIYLFVWYPLSALAFVVCSNTIKTRVKNLLLLSLCVFSLLNLIISYGYPVFFVFTASSYAKSSPDVWPEENNRSLLYRNSTVFRGDLKDAAAKSRAADWMIKNNYSILYGHITRTSEIAAFSDGKVTAGVWIDEIFDISPYINILDIYSQSDNGDALYLIQEDERGIALGYAKMLGVIFEEVITFDDYRLYKSDTQLMRDDTARFMVSQKFIINEVEMPIEVYSIYNSIHISLRDLAYMLNDTQKQFDFSWDNENGHVIINSGSPYTGEATGYMELSSAAIPTYAIVNFDDSKKEFFAFSIRNILYFSLNDLEEAFGLMINYDERMNTFIVEL